MELLTRRHVLKAVAVTPLAATAFKYDLPKTRKRKKMTSPQVITIPPLAGTTPGNPAIQIPNVDSGNPTIVNQSATTSVTICRDTGFALGNIWNLGPGQAMSLPNAGGLNVMNLNTLTIYILVLDGIVDVEPPSYGGGLVVTGSIVAGNLDAELLPPPPPGYAYRLQTLTIVSGNTVVAANSFQVQLQTINNSVALPNDIVFAAEVVSGSIIAITYSFDGQVLTNSIFNHPTNPGLLALAELPGGGEIGQSLYFTLWYDLVLA